MKILLIGSGAREHVIAETLKKSKKTIIYSYLKSKNIGIISLSKDFQIGNYNDLVKIKNYAGVWTIFTEFSSFSYIHTKSCTWQ